MYTNISKAQALPLAAKISSQPRCFNSLPTLKSQSLPFSYHRKPYSTNPRYKFRTLEMCTLPNPHGLMLQIARRYCIARSFSNAENQLPWLETDQVKERRVMEKGKKKKVGSSFQEGSGKVSCKSSWEQSVERLDKTTAPESKAPALPAPAFSMKDRVSTSVRTERRSGLAENVREHSRNDSRSKYGKFDDKHGLVENVRERRDYRGSKYGKFDDKNGLVENVRECRDDRSSKYGKFDDKNGLVENVRERRDDRGSKYWKSDDKNGLVENVRERRDDRGSKYWKSDDKNGLVANVRERRDDRSSKYGKFDDNDEVEVDDEMEEEEEVVDDPRWDNIKNRFKGVVRGRERPEFQRWDREENWGRKTWKEASESTVPKIVGEGIYGVGPVLAALSAGRREFYALYVQQGLDLSSNNRKKKDKKGFERVLKIAEKVGLNIKEAPKHDLNMVVDNRPHQGLVLDASPLEMVKIQELDPLSIEEGNGSLWVALDEVTDPQNLGAIIRSAYFFGASGIVLCAKNSAPLSGVVSKASAGSLELMELRYCKNMMQFLVSSAENGWRVLGGSVSSKAISLNEIVPGPPTILVLGSEGTGLRPLVERSCTQLVTISGNIPLDVSTSELEGESSGLNCESSGKGFLSFLAVESLNVSVAAGVLLHHLIGKRSADSLPGGHIEMSE